MPTPSPMFEDYNNYEESFGKGDYEDEDEDQPGESPYYNPVESKKQPLQPSNGRNNVESKNSYNQVNTNPLKTVDSID